MKRAPSYWILGALALVAFVRFLWHPIAGGAGLAVAGIWAWHAEL